MRKIITSLVLGVSTVAVSLPSFAASTPTGFSVDERVKNVVYNENDVISLTGYYGYQTTIRFANYEKIQNISIGDSVAWQVVPNKVGNILFVKPVEERATTNMTVITDRRIYNFELTSGQAHSPKDGRITYMLKFSYPQDSILDFTSDETGTQSFVPASNRPFAPSSISPTGRISSVGAPRDLNFDYSYKGEDNLAPSTVFDNGEFTFFKFSNQTNLPAIFEVDQDRNESVVNYHLENGYVVVESLGRQFTLRHGDEEACVFNDNFSEARSLLVLNSEG